MDKDAQGQTRVGAWPTLVVCTLVVERAKVLQYGTGTPRVLNHVQYVARRYRGTVMYL